MPVSLSLGTLTDADLWALKQALAGVQAPSSPTPPTVPPATQPTRPASFSVVDVPWIYRAGLQSAQIPAGRFLAFRFVIPAGYSSRQQACGFSFAPTGGDDYFFREYALSTLPGDFSSIAQTNNEAGALFFTVGGRRLIGIIVKRPDMSMPDLVAGQTYFVNVRQQDPMLSCRINYSLAIV